MSKNEVEELRARLEAASRETGEVLKELRELSSAASSLADSVLVDENRALRDRVRALEAQLRSPSHRSSRNSGNRLSSAVLQAERISSCSSQKSFGSSIATSSSGSIHSSDSFDWATSLMLQKIDRTLIRADPSAPLGFAIASRIVVTDVAGGGPAALAGVGLGDCVLAVAGQDSRGMSVQAVTRLVSSMRTVTLNLLSAAAADSGCSSEQARQVNVIRAGGKCGFGFAHHLVVTQVEPGTAAAAAGIKIGDRLVKVGQVDTLSMDVEAARRLLQHPSLEVKLTIGECTLRM